ncbi:hypothetical protein NP493_298g02040 [Ridgeia piscesae]|uniref:Uncharacterized protein n=1 Tax=Ridgeia piscesae TaxID=27915 RepID=A0AAD9NV97_RIDPI|nr:hypothetical protein NP493_298g02040 [Ridgeia piscesae]
MSPQSSSPSQCHRRGTQLELAHWNWVSLHDAATTIWSHRHSPTTIWSQGHSPTTTWSQGHYNNNPESGAPQQQPGVRGTTTTTWSQGHYNNNLESGALKTTRSQGHPNNNLESGALQQQPGVRGTPTTTWSQGHYNNNLESGALQQQLGDGWYFYNNLELGGRLEPIHRPVSGLSDSPWKHSQSSLCSGSRDLMGNESEQRHVRWRGTGTVSLGGLSKHRLVHAVFTWHGLLPVHTLTSIYSLTYIHTVP